MTAIPLGPVTLCRRAVGVTVQSPAIVIAVIIDTGDAIGPRRSLVSLTEGKIFADVVATGNKPLAETEI